MPDNELNDAAAAWVAMRQIVDQNGRMEEVQDALKLGHGSGRFRTLLALAASGELSLGELAAAIAVDAPYATLIVNQLEALRLVSRLPDPANGRRKLVSLTQAGTSAISQALAIVNRPPAAFEQLDRQELRQLRDLLERLRAAQNP